MGSFRDGKQAEESDAASFFDMVVAAADIESPRRIVNSASRDAISSPRSIIGSRRQKPALGVAWTTEEIMPRAMSTTSRVSGKSGSLWSGVLQGETPTRYTLICYGRRGKISGTLL